MCGRYYIAKEDPTDELLRILKECRRREKALKTSGEIRPGDTVPVMANDRAMKPGVFAMRWGYRLGSGKLCFNARSETAGEKELFRDGMQHRRCVVPASGYYEWEHHDKSKTKYAIRSAASGVTYLAGLYRFEDGSPVFTILTREPSEAVAHIHDRMPVILSDNAVRAWIDPVQNAEDILMTALLNVTFEVEE